MKHFTTLAIAALLSLSCAAQTAKFDWLKRIGDSGDEYIGRIANDSAGNLYASGTFFGTLIFGTDTLTSTSAINGSNFLVKYDTAGTVLWARKLPLTNPSVGYDGVDILNLRISPTGKIYIVGRVNDNAYSKEYVAAYRPSGTLIGYADQAVGNRNEDVDIDSMDNAYIVGRTTSAITKAFVFKLDSSGNTKWSYIFNQESRVANVRYVNGTVHITGQFHYQLQLTDTLGTTPIMLTASGGINDWDFFYAVYSKNGRLLSGARQQGLTPSAAGPFDIAADFTSSGTWRIANIDPSYPYATHTTAYLANFAVSDSATFSRVDSCNYVPPCFITCDRFRHQSVFTYAGLVCISKNAYVLDSSNQVVAKVPIPYAGPSNSAPFRHFSFDTSKNLFAMSTFKGTINYRDPTGSQSVSSASGSVDLYVGKVHQCRKYTPILFQQHDTVLCTATGVLYQWFSNNVLASSGSSGYYVATQSGDIQVVVTNSWGCTDTSSVLSVTMMPSAITFYARGTRVTVIPNPTKGNITVSGIQKGEQVRVVDLLGRAVLETTAQDTSETLSLVSIAPGMYILETGSGRVRVVKE